MGGGVCSPRRGGLSRLPSSRFTIHLDLSAVLCGMRRSFVGASMTSCRAPRS